MKWVGVFVCLVSVSAWADPVCGNGVVEAGEACDDGNTTSGDGCRGDCLRAEVCGDGVVNVGEQCDKGAANSDSKANACRTDCLAAHCGDRVVDAGETCDDGNQNNGDGCDATCQTEGAHTCGNGILEPGEQCDDGNISSADGCSSICRQEEGYSSDTPAPTRELDPSHAFQVSMALTMFGPPGLGFIYGPSAGHIYAGEGGHALLTSTMRAGLLVGEVFTVRAITRGDLDIGPGATLLGLESLTLSGLILYDLLDGPHAVERAKKRGRR